MHVGTKTQNNQCKLCGGRGFIIIDSPNSQSTIKQCECNIMKNNKEKVLSNFKESGIDPSKTNNTFKNFNTDTPVRMRMKDVASNFVLNFEKIKNTQGNTLTLLGTPGCGKTHLCNAIAFKLLKQKYNVVYMSYVMKITDLKQYKYNFNYIEKYQEEMSKLKTADVLIIDDLFKGEIQQRDIEIIREILWFRYTSNKPMVISSEYSLKDMIKIDEALGTRVYEMSKKYTCYVEGAENNYRLKGDVR